MDAKKAEQYYSPKHEEKLEYSGPLSAVSKEICKAYGLGDFRSNRIIRQGFEDFNMRLSTSTGNYFVKIFARHRDHRTSARIVDAMVRACKAGISTPKIYKSADGYLCSVKVGGHTMHLCVTDFIDGKSVFDGSGRFTESDIMSLAAESARINSIRHRLSDGSEIWETSWSRVSLPKSFSERSRYLSVEDRKLVEPVVREYLGIGLKAFPTAFVHADISTTNVIRDSKGKLWIVDFSVADNYPRIIELAFLATNLQGRTKGETETRLGIALEAYQRVLRLTRGELDALPVLIKTQFALLMINSMFFTKVFGDKAPKVNKSWYRMAKDGLIQSNS